MKPVYLHTRRCIEFSTAFALFFGKLSDAVFISSAKDIAVTLGLSHIHIGKKVNDIAKDSLVQIWAGIILWEHVLEFLVVIFDCTHSIINNRSDFRLMCRCRDLVPAGILRHEEYIILKVCIRIILESIPLSYKLLILLVKCP